MIVFLLQRCYKDYVVYLWERQGFYIERGLDVGEIFCRYVSVYIIEVDLGIQRGIYIDGLKDVVQKSQNLREWFWRMVEKKLIFLESVIVRK